jgi:hypothetical protein
MTNSRRIRQAETNSPSPALPLIKLLLVLLILLLLPDLVISKRGGSANRRKSNKITKSFNNAREECIEECDPSNMAENQMCISGCISPKCHEEIYGHGGGELESELDPGEIDDKRGDAFDRCVRDELRREVARERQNRKQQSKESL